MRVKDDDVRRNRRRVGSQGRERLREEEKVEGSGGRRVVRIKDESIRTRGRREGGSV